MQVFPHLYCKYSNKLGSLHKQHDYSKKRFNSSEPTMVFQMYVRFLFLFDILLIHKIFVCLLEKLLKIKIRLNRKSEMFGDSCVDLKQLIFDYFDNYYTTKYREKFNHYHIFINTSNRDKYYSINSVKIYRTCTISRKFRECKIDSRFGDSMESFLTQNRKCMMARLFVKVDVDVVKYKSKHKHKNSNSNKNENENESKNSNDINNDKDMNDSELINESSIVNEVINDVKRKNKNVNHKQFKTKSKHFNLFIASPFHFIHLSSMKYFRIDNKLIYKLLSNKFVVGNVNDILLKVWMVHGCMIDKSDFVALYGKIKDYKLGLCKIGETQIHHNCHFHSLFFLDQYGGRWEKLLYRKACCCLSCNQQ